MAWIRTIGYAESTGRLRQLYDRIKGPGDNVDNIMMAHSLRPHTMEGHMTLYKYVLHHPGNRLPKWLLETIGELKQSGFEECRKLGRTLENWQAEIGRMWRFSRSNGITEGFHRKMKLIQRRAFGFRNFENYRRRVRALCT